MDKTPELALANIGIAVTRPVNQAKQLTQLIQRAGGSVISFPLIDIVSLKDYTAFEKSIAQINHIDWAVFISSNAVQHGIPHMVKAGIPPTLKFAAIGPKTAQALNQFGIHDVLIPGRHQAGTNNKQVRYDSESLLSMPEMHNMQGKSIMIVRGIGGRAVLANTLKSRGAKIIFAECYQRINPQNNGDILTEAYAKQQLQSIIVTSSEAMRYLLDIVGAKSWLNNITICVNHLRIAELPLKMGLNVAIADAPGDEAMFKLLCKTLHH